MRAFALAAALVASVPHAAQNAAAQDFAKEVGERQLMPARLGASMVHDAAGEEVGDVEGMIVNESGTVDALVIGFGGVLGLAEKLVAVPWSKVAVARPDKGTVRFDLALTRAELDAAPEFTMPK